jgi:hypothetical protein
MKWTSEELWKYNWFGCVDLRAVRWSRQSSEPYMCYASVCRPRPPWSRRKRPDVRDSGIGKPCAYRVGVHGRWKVLQAEHRRYRVALEESQQPDVMTQWVRHYRRGMPAPPLDMTELIRACESLMSAHAHAHSVATALWSTCEAQPDTRCRRVTSNGMCRCGLVITWGDL